MRKTFLSLLLLVWLQALPLYAQNAEYPNAVSAKFNLIDYGFSYDRSVQISQGFEIGYIRNLAKVLNLAIPFKVGLAKFPKKTDNTVTISTDLILQLQGSLLSGKIIPYAMGGAGFFYEQDGESHIQFPFGAGINFQVSPFLFINAQGEYRVSGEENRSNIQGGLGFVYLLHKVAPRPLYLPDLDQDGTPDNIDQCPDIPGSSTAMGCPDRDGDGVTDSEDQCPEESGLETLSGCPDYDNDGFADKNDECPTLAGTVNGCPDTDGDGVTDKDDKCPDVSGIAANNGCPPEKDTDGDGIIDKADRCPEFPGLINLNGCPDSDGDGVANLDDPCPTIPGTLSGCPDSDKDGVSDKDDKCPNSPGLASNNGCPEIKQEVKARLDYAKKAVQFQTGKAILKPESFVVLDEIVNILREYPDYNLAIGGHTDNIGNDDKNMSLSTERAKTCYDYLVFRGIPSKRIRYAGFGESRPAADNQTAEGRELNRRVEFELTLE